MRSKCAGDTATKEPWLANRRHTASRPSRKRTSKGEVALLNASATPDGCDLVPRRCIRGGVFRKHAVSDRTTAYAATTSERDRAQPRQRQAVSCVWSIDAGIDVPEAIRHGTNTARANPGQPIGTAARHR